MINHLEQFFFLCLTIFFSRCISALVIASRARKQAKEKQFSFFCLSFCICFAVCRSSQNNMVEAKSFVSLAPKWISKSRKWQRKPKKNNAPVTSRTLNTTDKSKKKHILINCCYLCSLVSNGALFRVRKKRTKLVLQYVFVGCVYFVAIILHIPDFYGQINILSGLHMQDKVSTAVKLCCSKRNAYKFAHMKIQIHNETAQSAWMPTMVLFHIPRCVFFLPSPINFPFDHTVLHTYIQNAYWRYSQNKIDSVTPVLTMFYVQKELDESNRKTNWHKWREFENDIHIHTHTHKQNWECEVYSSSVEGHTQDVRRQLNTTATHS